MGTSSTASDVKALIVSLRSAYGATPLRLKIIDLYVAFALVTALVQYVRSKGVGILYIKVSFKCYLFFCYSLAGLPAFMLEVMTVVYMTIVGSFPFNAFLSGVLSCVGTAVLAVCLRMQVNKENKEFKDLSPARAFADFVLCNIVLHLVIMNFLG